MCKRWQQPSSATIVAVFEEIFFFSNAHAHTNYLLRGIHLQKKKKEKILLKLQVPWSRNTGVVLCFFWAPQPVERRSSHWDAWRTERLKLAAVQVVQNIKAALSVDALFHLRSLTAALNPLKGERAP